MSAKINIPKQVLNREDLDGPCLVGPMYLVSPDPYFYYYKCERYIQGVGDISQVPTIGGYIYSVYGATFLAPTAHSP